MEIHQIEYFLAVYKLSSFTRAAEHCHVSQPSLSAQLAKLEYELGGQLIERNRKGSRLTSRGEVFLPRAQEIIRNLESARRDMDELDSSKRGSIHLGCLPTTGAFILPPILLEYKKRFPKVEIRLSEGSSPTLAEKLLNFDIEIAIMDEAGLRSGLQSTELLTEPLYIALPPDHPLAEHRDLHIHDLRHQPLILMQSGHGFHNIVAKALAEAGIDPHVVYESSEIETVQVLVRASLGISIVPRMICHHRDIAYRNIVPPAPSRTLHLAWRESASLSPALERFRDIAALILQRDFTGE